MRALTVKRPWAQLIVLGVKNIENRGWRTNYQGPLVIHAGQQWDAAAVTRAQILQPGRDDVPFLAALDPQQASVGYLGVVQLTQVCSQSVHGIGCDCGPWAVPGQHHWILTNPQALPAALPGRGSPGLQRVPPDVQRIIRRMRTALGGGGQISVET